MDGIYQSLLLLIAGIVIYFMLAPRWTKAKPKENGNISTKLPLSDSEKIRNNRLITRLQKELPLHSVTLPDDQDFQTKVNVHWAQQARENLPSCIITPRTAEELSTAVKLIKQEYDQQRRDGEASALFAVRSGGHSPSIGAASIANGFLINMGVINSVTISSDRKTVDIGAGAKWGSVTKTLDAANLAVVGGRSSLVGVGGLTLGGGISYFSPRFGFVCSNVLSYEIVLASGSIVTVSATSHPKLWRALKGGLNNFGIVTKFTFKAFPGHNFWSGWLYMPPFQPQKAMAAFQEFVGRRTNYDPYAGGPILAYNWIYPLGIKLVTCGLSYTKQPDNKKGWPECFTNSGFSSLWRAYSTCKIQSLTSMIDEMEATQPAGKRQILATTTITNCLETMRETHAIITEMNSTLRRKGRKSWLWALIFQPILPDMMHKASENCLGLAGQEEPLIIVSFNVTWEDASLDTMLNDAVKTSIGSIEAMAKRRKTWHQYKTTNYCAHWQNPLAGYGDENLQFLRDVSEEVDPDQLFQRGCPGGFKLWDKVDSQN